MYFSLSSFVFYVPRTFIAVVSSFPLSSVSPCLHFPLSPTGRYEEQEKRLRLEKEEWRKENWTEGETAVIQEEGNMRTVGKKRNGKTVLKSRVMKIERILKGRKARGRERETEMTTEGRVEGLE